MPLNVAPVSSPTLVNAPLNPTPTISGVTTANPGTIGPVISATPGSNGFLGLDSGTSSTPTASAPTANVDPYANTVFGSTANFNKLSGDWNAQKDTTLNSINDRVEGDANKYNSGILDYIDSLKAGQSKIDRESVQNELARNQGQAGVLDTIGHGVKSAGVVLANKNASNSSAAEAIARAYGDIGTREMGKVGNQYQQGISSIANDQNDFEASSATNLRHIQENKTDIVNGIVSDATSAISQLNTSAASASLPDRVDIEAKKAEIKNAALAKLQALDGQLSAANVRPSDVTANRTAAANLATMGTTADRPFDFSPVIPAQFENTGPYSSELPLFTTPPKKQTA